MDTQTDLVTMRVADGTSMEAVVAEPKAGGPWPGILYPFEAWGLTDQMVRHAERMAAEGFVVIVPDLFHRQGRLRTATHWEFEWQERAVAVHPIGARVLMWNLRNDQVFDDMDAARDYLKGLPNVRPDRLGVVGSWLGARVALFYATLRPEIKALVQFGGAGAASINLWEDYLAHLAKTGEKPPTDPTPAGNKKVIGTVMDNIDKLQAPVLVLAAFGGDKRTEEGPVEAALRKAGKRLETHEYPNSKAGFANPAMPGHYNAAYAADAWKRTFSFLKKELAG